MKKVNKTILLIASIYVIHLLVYIGMVHVIDINIRDWTNVVEKLKINSNIDSYTHLYVHIYFFVLSIYFLLKSLNISINRGPKIIIFAVAYAFIFIGLYKYYDIKYFIQMLLIASGLILTLNMLYKKINIYNYEN
ncbi:hypothetical protein [Clostridiisalibacter paucivorans]|uniref:hypothetical protein n=1 Tax=Clostridiisalibacter paucivorans TaxID=408753 RepID=UPI00047CD8F9|nr:hypothetical protein [Clostridiisalibacter paucivorans]